MRRLANGDPGDYRSVGGGVMEMRMQFGPGYRVYYIQRGSVVTILLCGGDKSSQSNDIARARELVLEMEEE